MFGVPLKRARCTYLFSRAGSSRRGRNGVCTGSMRPLCSLVLISALFGVLSYLSVRVWQLRESAPVEQQGELELRGEKIG